MSERKEWFKVVRPTNGKNLWVTVTLQEGNVSVKWSVPAFSTSIKSGLVEAKAGAEKALAEVQEAIRELEEE